MTIQNDRGLINISNEVFMRENGLPGIKFYIVPCISYVNPNNVEGIMFYTNNRKSGAQTALSNRAHLQAHDSGARLRRTAKKPHL